MIRSNKILDPTTTGREAENLEREMKKLIVGQDEAIAQIVNIYQMYITGLSSPDRPVGNLLFLGPTGSGKTRVVEALAEILVGSARAVIKVDCAEYQFGHEIAKLIGSPPGYLGHRETHALLSQEVLNQHHTEKVKLSFVLFDEIEKASDALWNLTLGVTDKASLTLGDNRRVSFSRAFIFMTSNIGAREMGNLMTKQMGFGCFTEQTFTSKNVDETALRAARTKFTPEFMNRLDKIVVFKPLGEGELRKILDIELKMVQQRIFNASPGKSFVFTTTDSAKDHLLKEGTDPKYGARHLKRAIERLIVQPLSSLIATDQVRCGDWIKVDHKDGKMAFLKEAEGLPAFGMAEMTGENVELLSAKYAVAGGSGNGGVTQTAKSSKGK